MYKAADKEIGDQLTATQAASKISADMKLMRDLFLSAVGPAGSNGNGDKMNDLVQKMTRLPSKAQLSSPGRTHSYSLDGAPRLSPEIIDLLNLVSPLGLSLAQPQNQSALSARAMLLEIVHACCLGMMLPDSEQKATLSD